MAQHLPYLATILTAALLFAVAFMVGRARRRYGVSAPAVTGNIDFERAYRTQVNTIESAAYFLPLMWVFSIYVSPLWGGALGLLWVVGRIAYAVQYTRGSARTAPFFVHLGVCGVYLIGSLIGVSHQMIAS